MRSRLHEGVCKLPEYFLGARVWTLDENCYQNGQDYRMSLNHINSKPITSLNSKTRTNGDNIGCFLCTGWGFRNLAGGQPYTSIRIINAGTWVEGLKFGEQYAGLEGMRVEPLSSVIYPLNNYKYD